MWSEFFSSQIYDLGLLVLMVHSAVNNLIIYISTVHNSIIASLSLLLLFLSLTWSWLRLWLLYIIIIIIIMAKYPDIVQVQLKNYWNLCAWPFLLFNDIEVLGLTLLFRVVNFAFRQCMHVEASLSGIHTAACSFIGSFPAGMKLKNTFLLQFNLNANFANIKKW